MSRIGYTPAYDAEKSHPYHRGIEDRHRLRQIDADHRWKSFAFPPLSPAAQELIVAGGAESLVAARLRAKP